MKIQHGENGRAWRILLRAATRDEKRRVRQCLCLSRGLVPESTTRCLHHGTYVNQGKARNGWFQ